MQTNMRVNLVVFRTFFVIFTYMLKPRYDTKMQLLAFLKHNAV